MTGVSPNSGPTTGGGSYVTISGGGFYGPNGASDVTSVSFGGTASSMFDVMNGGVIEAYAPAHTAGTVDVTVTTANGMSSTSSADQFTYVPIATTTTLTSNANPSTYGQSITLTATVSNGGQGSLTGLVTFEDGTTVLGRATSSAGGQATLTTFSLTVGNHPISAIYGGDPFNAISISGVVNENVQPIPTTTSLSSSAATWFTPGQTLTLTATVTAANDVPTGTVTFMSGATVLGTAPLVPGVGMEATLTTALPLLASQSVVAVYGGDVADAASTSNPLTLTYVPTEHYWINATGNGLASTAANWSGGPFGPGDSLVVDGIHAANSNTPLNFNIAPTDANGNPLLANMQILTNYTAVVAFTQSPSFTNTFSDASSAPVGLGSGVTVTATNLYLTGANVSGLGKLSTAGAGVATIGTGAYLSGIVVTLGQLTNWSLNASTLDNGAQIINYGKGVWQSGDVDLNNQSLIINSGDFQIVGDLQNMTTVGGGAFENSGTLERTALASYLPPSGSAPKTFIDVAFYNGPFPGFSPNPSVTVEAGTLVLEGSGEDAAPFTVNAGATLTFNDGTQILDPGTSFTGLGRFRVDGGVVTANMGANILINTANFDLGVAPGAIVGGQLNGMSVVGGVLGSFTITGAVGWATAPG